MYMYIVVSVHIYIILHISEQGNAIKPHLYIYLPWTLPRVTHWNKIIYAGTTPV